MRSGLVYLSFDRSVYYIRGVWLVFTISELNANSVDPEQTLRSAAYDLGLHFMPMPLLWDSRLNRQTIHMKYQS